MAGRPSTFSEELAATICARIAEGESLRTVCKCEEMPAASTVFRWLGSNETFQEQYAHAREASADAMAEDILDIADDGTNDWRTKTNDDGSEYEVLDAEHIQRSRLRVDARKWLMSKLQSKKYGDKLQANVDGAMTFKIVDATRD